MKKVLFLLMIVGSLVLSLSGCESDNRTCAEQGGKIVKETIFLPSTTGMSPAIITSCVIPKEKV